MDHKLLLAKSITLLYQESKIPELIENSSDLVRTVLNNIQVSEIGIGLTTTREVIINLKATALEMCDNPIDHVYDRLELLQRIAINTDTDTKLYEAIAHGLDEDITESSLKRSVTNIKKSINNHFKEQQISNILNKASYSFKYDRHNIKDVPQFISELLVQLETLNINTASRDPAIVDEVDIGDEDGLTRIFGDIIDAGEGTGVYKTGWTALNRMLQGGFRTGLSIIGALQHKYKTGLTLQIFKQIAQHNKPRTTDPNKKPLLLRISFEDDLNLNLQYLYTSLRYDETRSYVDIKEVSKDEMSKYVKSKLQINGFHIKMIRVDPTQWTYKAICNKIIEYEAQGYVPEVVILDYLYKVPTTGCMAPVPVGSDVCDMFGRMRSFFSCKQIVGITPHQLSTEAKQLIRNGIPEDQFVNEIAEKGYYEATRSLDKIVDLEIYLHIFKHNKEWFMSLRRGKHKIPTILENEEDKYMLMKFPKSMPIPDDRYEEDNSFRKLPSVASNTDDDLFKLG